MIHNKPKWNDKLKKLFGLPENAKVIYFRHPKEFNYFNLEKINPNHIGLIYGNLKKKYKSDKRQKIILMGKIKIPIVLFINNLSDKFVFFIEHFILSKSLIETTLNLTIAFCLLYCIYFISFNVSVYGLPSFLLKVR